MASNSRRWPLSMMGARCVRYSTARSLSTRRSMRWHLWNRGARRARSSSPCRSQAHDDKKLRSKGWWTLSSRQQIRDSRLEREQCALSIEAARISREAAVRPDDAVTGNDDADRIAPGCSTRGARAARASRATRELAVGDGLTETDRGDRLPHGPLKRRAFGRECSLETLALAGEVFGQLALGLTHRRAACVPPPLRIDVWKIFLAVEVDAGKSFAFCDEQHLPVRAFIEIVVVHGYSFVSDCHRCITAYARQGRQASPAARTWRAPVSPSAFISPKSVCGNASGQESARIAMYCAVHSPTPGRARSLSSVASMSAFGMRTRRPSATERASARTVRARALGKPMRAMRPGDRAATRIAAGNRVVSESNGVAIASPNIAAKRPATVRAAATVTCWPRIARTAISKPSNAPGTRKPGWRLASVPSACATSAGWHARSISALTRDSTGGSALASDAETATRSVGFLGDISTAIQPACSLPSLRMRTVRR